MERRFEVPSTLGSGEGDLPHKFHCLHHQMLLRTGGSKRLELYRWSRVAMLSDQGTEKGLESVPYFEDHERMVADVRSGTSAPLPSEPEKFYWPRMLGYSGPMHIVWNAFRSAIEGSALWDWFRSVFAAMLEVLGRKMMKRRFLALSSATPAQCKLFAGFGTKVVDWKWQYMEEQLERMSDCIELFWSILDVPKLQAPGGNQDENEVAIDGKCWAVLQATQALNSDKYSALVEMDNVFAGAVGRVGRWHKGCPCHDHIWCRSDITEARKAEIMLEESGGVSSTCWRRGRRASELARGKAKDLADSVKAANSVRLQERLAPLNNEDREELLLVFRTKKRSWCEEFLEKSNYHTLLPHVAAGLWPVDSGSAAVAKSMLEQWQAADKKTCHRVTWRLLNSKSRFYLPICRAAKDGYVNVHLALEAKHMNLAETCEQYLEESHARVHAIQLHPGTTSSPVYVCAQLRWPQNCKLFQSWVAFTFFRRLWRMRVLEHVLRPCDLSREFIRFRMRRDRIDSIYHSHPRQQFKIMHAEKKCLEAWAKTLAVDAPVLGTEESAGLNYLRHRLQDALFSLPQEMAILSSVTQDCLAVVRTDVLQNTFAHFHAALDEDVAYGPEHDDHLFLKCVKSVFTSRYYRGEDSHKFLGINVAVFGLGGSMSHDGNVVLPTEMQIARVNLVELMRRFGMRDILSQLVVWQEDVRVTLQCLAPRLNPHATVQSQRLGLQADVGLALQQPVDTRSLVPVSQAVVVHPQSRSVLERIFLGMAGETM